MAVAGINHITLAVLDLARSLIFYKEILGLKVLATWSQGAYLLAGENWICLSVDQNTRTNPIPEYTHLAFTVLAEDFELLCSKIKKTGAGIWKENISEGSSLYFLDPDGYKLEIHVGGWQARIQSAKEDPWDSEFKFFV